jgi:transcriptional regulator with XRE-family HTH domain
MREKTCHHANHLRAAIKEAGLTIAEVARETGIPVRTLFDYCAGRVRIPRKRLEAIARLLACPPELLVCRSLPGGGPHLLEWTQSAEAEADEASPFLTMLGEGATTIDRLRRALLQQLLLPLVTAAPWLHKTAQELIEAEAWERLALALKRSSRTDAATLAHLEAVTDLYWELYRSSLAKSDLLHAVSGHLMTLTQLLHAQQPLAIQRRLCVVCSNSAQILGEIALDQHDGERAAASYRLAIELAREGEQSALWALAAGRQAWLLVYQGAGKAALPTLEHALALGKSSQLSGQSLAWLEMMRAEVLAQEQDRSGCERALEHVHSWLDQSQAEQSPDQRWTGFQVSACAAYEGRCYLYLGSLSQARASLQQALQWLPAAPTRRRALVLVDLAHVAAREGELEEACSLAEEALMCACQARSPRALRAVHRLAQALQQWKRLPCVARLNRMLRLLEQASLS